MKNDWRASSQWTWNAFQSLSTEDTREHGISLSSMKWSHNQHAVQFIVLWKKIEHFSKELLKYRASSTSSHCTFYFEINQAVQEMLGSQSDFHS